MASLTSVCFVPAKGLVRDLSANSSNIAFEVPLASTCFNVILRLELDLHYISRVCQVIPFVNELMSPT